MTNVRRGYAASDADIETRRRTDSTRSDSARARSIALRNARAVKRAAVGGAR